MPAVEAATLPRLPLSSGPHSGSAGPELQLEGLGDVEKATDGRLEAQGAWRARALQREGLQDGGEQEEEFGPSQALPEADALTWTEERSGAGPAVLTARHTGTGEWAGAAPKIPKEKGRNASCFLNFPSASRNRPGLNSSGSSKTTGSCRMEPRRGKTSVPCGGGDSRSVVSHSLGSHGL